LQVVILDIECGLLLALSDLPALGICLLFDVFEDLLCLLLAI
jgi:energy-converting hydrogenase Eha subunit E